jgi:hypothetical protein
VYVLIENNFNEEIPYLQFAAQALRLLGSPPPLRLENKDNEDLHNSRQ